MSRSDIVFDADGGEIGGQGLVITMIVQDGDG